LFLSTHLIAKSFYDFLFISSKKYSGEISEWRKEKTEETAEGVEDQRVEQGVNKSRCRKGRMEQEESKPTGIIIRISLQIGNTDVEHLEKWPVRGDEAS
jgi:hypothetical protein